MESIVPALPELEPTLSPRERLALAVESNVRWTVRQILNTYREVPGLGSDISALPSVNSSGAWR